MKKEVYRELHKVLSRHDIYDLQASGTIKIGRDGKLVINVDGIYSLGIIYLQKGKWREALRLFNFCYKLNPFHVRSCLYLLKDALYKNNFKLATEYFLTLYANPKADTATKNFFLYLLQYLAPIPKDLRSKALALQPTDLVSKKLNETRKYRSEYRLAAYEGHFELAQNIAESEHAMRNTEDYIALRLIDDINALYKKLKIDISKKLYGEIIEILSPLRETLPQELETILLLAESALEIESTLTVPKVVSSKHYSFDEAIKSHNYAVALTLTDDELIKTMLENILSIIDDINYTSKDKEGVKLDNFDSYVTLMDITSLIVDVNLYGIDACALKHKLNDEQKLELIILYAEECYRNKLFTLGDKYLKLAQKSSEKTPRLISLLEEVSQKRHIYKCSRSIPQSILIKEKTED